jgi:hypothetical protein
MNKQLQTADKEWSSSFGVGQGANNSSPQKLPRYKTFKIAFDLD